MPPGTRNALVPPSPNYLASAGQFGGGVLRGLSNQFVTGPLQVVQQSYEDPYSLGQGVYEGARGLMADPVGVVGNSLRGMWNRAKSGPAGLGEVIGENIDPRNFLKPRKAVMAAISSPYNFKKESQRVSNLAHVENVSFDDYQPKTKKLNVTYAQPAKKDKFGYLQKFKLSRKMGDDQSINVYVGTDELSEDLPDPRFDPNDPPYMFGSYVDYSGETAPKGTGALTQMTLEALEIVKRDKGKKSGWISEGIRSAETDAKYERLIAAGVPFQRTETGTYFLMPQDLQALDLSKVSDALNKKYAGRK
jgi:hypothetical protein